MSLSAGLDGDRLVRLTVRDTGPGVSAELGERIFEQFLTTKEHGLGLGLPLARPIAERHGGWLWADWDEPGGVFHLTLCRTAGEPVAAADAPASEPPPVLCGSDG